MTPALYSEGFRRLSICCAPTRIEPESGLSSAPIRLSSVLFPLPEGPISETNSPGSICRVTSSSERMSPPSKLLRTCSTVTATPCPLFALTVLSNRSVGLRDRSGIRLPSAADRLTDLDRRSGDCLTPAEAVQLGPALYFKTETAQRSFFVFPLALTTACSVSGWPPDVFGQVTFSW